MEKFYTPKDVEREFGIERTILTQWRANLIGPGCIRWKGKILYHARDIEEWFKFEETYADAKPEKKYKKEAGTEKQPEASPETAEKIESHENQKLIIDFDHELLTPTEVSQLLDISEKTLANWRSEGRGPAYHKMGKRIRYPSKELKKWFSQNKIKRYRSKRR